MTWFAGFKNKKDILKCIRRIPVFMHIYYLVLSGSIFYMWLHKFIIMGKVLVMVLKKCFSHQIMLIIITAKM